ncbi:unnamed protein product [Darwinula stevensoni]|uniref:t-SNARE coiled-coil homology domain-containing protein n=1 Tax=Darwinula stevensoni TaxID=69355 RepID=A0A7R9A610_9CRUS|nr:unnamed protein product [Darwinula stevensoni]CAG0895621.1 unnamed protein product [Darwinula stevensoni]
MTAALPARLPANLTRRRAPSQHRETPYRRTDSFRNGAEAPGARPGPRSGRSDNEASGIGKFQRTKTKILSEVKSDIGSQKMASRSHTEFFVAMRNKAAQNQHFVAEHEISDRSALVRKDPADLEIGASSPLDGRPPPDWIDAFEDVQYNLSKLPKKIQELKQLHERHLTRPSLDESTEEEKQIEALSRDISRMFSHSQRLLLQIKGKASLSRSDDGRLSKNVISSLASSMQDLTSAFRMAQSTYLKNLKSREEWSQQYFEIPTPLNTTVNQIIDEPAGDMVWFEDPKETQQQLLLLEENTEWLNQRDKEIQEIVKSIVELNDMFRDLAQLVIDQGTVLDRIDYNMENCQVRVHEGLQQLQKAAHHQHRSRKMMCFMGLAGTTLLLVIILIIVKS